MCDETSVEGKKLKYFINACKKNDISEVKRILSTGEIDLSDHIDFRTPLGTAITNQHSELVNLLAENSDNFYYLKFDIKNAVEAKCKHDLLELIKFFNNYNSESVLEVILDRFLREELFGHIEFIFSCDQSLKRFLSYIETIALGSRNVKILKFIQSQGDLKAALTDRHTYDSVLGFASVESIKFLQTEVGIDVSEAAKIIWPEVMCEINELDKLQGPEIAFLRDESGVVVSPAEIFIKLLTVDGYEINKCDCMDEYESDARVKLKVLSESKKSGAEFDFSKSQELLSLELAVQRYDEVCDYSYRESEFIYNDLINLSEKIKFCVREKFAFGLSALKFACENQSESLLDLLLSTGSNPDEKLDNGNSLLLELCKGEESEIFSSEKYQLYNKKFKNCSDARRRLIEVLVNYKAGLDTADEKGLTPLIYSKKSYDVQLSRILINAGASVDGLDERLKELGVGKYPPGCAVLFWTSLIVVLFLIVRCA